MSAAPSRRAGREPAVAASAPAEQQAPRAMASAASPARKTPDATATSLRQIGRTPPASKSPPRAGKPASPNKGVCQYYNTPSGCFKGVKCVFAHEGPARGSPTRSAIAYAGGRPRDTGLRSASAGRGRRAPVLNDAASAMRSKLFGFRACVMDVLARARNDAATPVIVFTNVQVRKGSHPIHLADK